VHEDVIGEAVGPTATTAEPLADTVNGDFDALFDEHFDRAVRLAALTGGPGIDAQGIAADALARVWLKWRARSVDDFWPYLRSAVVNGVRSAERHHRVVDRYAQRERPVTTTAGSESTIVERAAVAAAMARLPNRQRTALVLRYFEDLSVEQCADVMRCSVGTAKSTTARALAALRAVLEEQDDEIHG
jgi:RNA polymerase sigma-70 factor (sigma-E family)